MGVQLSWKHLPDACCSCSSKLQICGAVVGASIRDYCRFTGFKLPAVLRGVGDGPCIQTVIIFARPALASSAAPAAPSCPAPSNYENLQFKCFLVVASV